jgi:hypothetical protein
MRNTYDGPMASLEARWGPNGAVCLNTPRVTAHPSPLSLVTFPAIEAQIALNCPRPATCVENDVDKFDGRYLVTAHPAPSP